MLDLSSRIKHYQKIFAKKFCDKDDISDCNKGFCYCRQSAELWAYIESVVPEGYSKYTILDFTGQIAKSNDRERVLSNTKSLEVKNKICEYCWGVNWQQVITKYPLPKDQRKFLNSHSIIDKRLKSGKNVVIYGSESKQLGRSLIATIIMKEAIKLRKQKGYQGQTYAWVDMPFLRKLLINDSTPYNKTSYDLAFYKTCDWLVVDNIIDNVAYSDKHSSFQKDLFDPFFIERFKSELPTILIFKFDIQPETSLVEKKMGIGLSNFINSKETTIISLEESYV